MLLRDFDYPLQKAIRDYLETCEPESAVLQIDIDLTSDTFHYSLISNAQHQQDKKAAANR